MLPLKTAHTSRLRWATFSLTVRFLRVVVAALRGVLALFFLGAALLPLRASAASCCRRLSHTRFGICTLPSAKTTDVRWNSFQLCRSIKVRPLRAHRIAGRRAVGYVTPRAREEEPAEACPSFPKSL